jgi:hypothetical protein
MFKWIISDFFEKAGSTPAGKHTTNKQAQTSFYYKPARRIHPDYVDTLHD